MRKAAQDALAKLMTHRRSLAGPANLTSPEVTVSGHCPALWHRLTEDTTTEVEELCGVWQWWIDRFLLLGPSTGLHSMPIDGSSDSLVS